MLLISYTLIMKEFFWGEKSGLAEWIQLVFAVVAGCYALYLFRQSRREKRNQFILEILNKIHNDEEVRTIIYEIDRGKDLSGIRYKGSLEKQADKIIQYFDYIGFLIKEGNIKQSDIRPFRYQINKVLTNEEVKIYIKKLKNNGVSLDNLKYLDETKN